MDHPLPVIGITMGDPVGIGPEIVCKALSSPGLHHICRPLVLGDTETLERAAACTDAPLALHEVRAPHDGVYRPGTMDVVAVSHLDPGKLVHGSPNVGTATAMVQYIMQAVDWSLDGRLDGIATCPIHKAAMRMAGFPYDGHTELLAQRTGTRQYVMMLAGDRLRVVLVTIHTALKEVPRLLSQEKIETTILLTAQGLQERFGIPQPKIAVAALNPHGGEGGMFGDEEIRHITPAVSRCRSMEMEVEGPLPADTLFHRALQGHWDAVVCMYHDQGLIPFKMIHFTDGVNTTLGLPIVRTSVDHGTAYQIAGKGIADHRSLLAAIRMAVEQVRQLRRSRRQASH